MSHDYTFINWCKPINKIELTMIGGEGDISLRK